MNRSLKRALAKISGTEYDILKITKTEAEDIKIPVNKWPLIMFVKTMTTDLDCPYSSNGVMSKAILISLFRKSKFYVNPTTFEQGYGKCLAAFRIHWRLPCEKYPFGLANYSLSWIPITLR